MIYRLLLVSLLFISCKTDTQNSGINNLEPEFEITLKASLDPSITESSGIVVIDNKIYTHSDVGGVATLLQINLDGSIEQQLRFENATLKDWEDVAVDDTFLYIGDIGNNLANRTDLQLLRIQRSQLEDPNAGVDSIGFLFEDQTEFGNGEYNQTSYDVEAFTILNNKLYIFTKDWIHLDTSLYIINNEPGVTTVSPTATLNIGGLVTGATTSPEGDIILCGYSPTLSPFVARISVKNGIPKMERKVNLTGMLGTASQIEGIAFAGIFNNAATYYLTSEQFTRSIAGNQITLPAQLYELRWNE